MGNAFHLLFYPHLSGGIYHSFPVNICRCSFPTALPCNSEREGTVCKVTQLNVKRIICGLTGGMLKLTLQLIALLSLLICG